MNSVFETDRLVVVRAGDNSLHPQWLAREPQRRWRLHISYYGKLRDPYPLPPGVTLSRELGSKWVGLKALFEGNPELLRNRWIALPDDDLKFTSGAWDDLFEMMVAGGISLGQPALEHLSFYSHDITLRRHRLDYRLVDFVEVMIPLFDARFLSDLVPLFDLNQSSWGLDIVWSQEAKEQNRKMAIFDACSVRHTRAIRPSQYKGVNPLKEKKATLADRGITEWKPRAVAGYRDGHCLPLSLSQLNKTQVAAMLLKHIRTLARVRQIA
jgi:hypothetical protein